MLKITLKTIHEIIQDKAKEKGYKALIIENYPHKDDDFLRVVIAQNENKNEYVCWIYNVNDNAFYSGYYVDTFEKADWKLKERISK